MSKHGVIRLSQSPQSKGGQQRAANLTPEKRSEIARKAAEARWSLPKATHEGTLTLPGVVPLRVANLDNGLRVMMSRAVLEALGRPWKGTYRQGVNKRTERPNFIDAPNLDPYITPELEAYLEPIEYISERGRIVQGFRAELLPLVCEAYLRARDEDALTARQEPIAEYADRLMRGLARLGIVTLIDDATGYTKVRAREELQAILAAYIAPELLPWSQRFPQSFYEELHRVRGWKYAAGSNKRNHYIGRLTNELIYKQLPDGVLDELRAKNPRDPEKGRRRYTHHRFLTDEVGNPHLEKQIVAVTTLLSVSDDWPEFLRLFAKKFSPRTDDLFAIKPPKDDGHDDA